MSVKAVEAAMQTRAPSLAAKLVMLVLAYHHNAETSLCFPSLKRIAEESGLNQTSVSRALKELQTANLLRWRKARRAGSTHANNHYALVFTSQRVMTATPKFSGLREGATPTKQELSASTAKASEAARARKARSHKALPRRRIADTWHPTPTDRVYAEEKLVGMDVDREIRMFRNYWLGEGTTKAKWGATFRKWVDQAKAYAERDDGKHAGAGPNGRGNERLDGIRRTHEAALAAARELDGRDGRGPGGGPAAGDAGGVPGSGKPGGPTGLFGWR